MLQSQSRRGGGHWELFSTKTLRSAMKKSYFEVLMELKKIGHTICDPYLIFKKIFSLRHHGVKSF